MNTTTRSKRQVRRTAASRSIPGAESERLIATARALRAAVLARMLQRAMAGLGGFAARSGAARRPPLYRTSAC